MAATAITYERGTKQERGLWSDMWTVKGTLDVASLNDAAGSTETFAVPGVALGDQVIAIGFSIDLAGITVTGYVSAANVVSLRVQNESGGTVDLASATVKIIVGRPTF